MADTKDTPVVASAPSSPFGTYDPEPNPDPMREVAEALPERNALQKAHKAAMLAETPAEEAKEKAKIVALCPDSQTTPSGIALQKAAKESDDKKRGEVYLREKQAVRWGWVPVDES